jgi:hypothetical protein
MNKNNITSLAPAKQTNAEAERINWIVSMNKWRTEANASGNLAELETIALEYEAHNMTATAREIRIAVATREKARTK